MAHLVLPGAGGVCAVGSPTSGIPVLLVIWLTVVVLMAVVRVLIAWSTMRMLRLRIEGILVLLLVVVLVRIGTIVLLGTRPYEPKIVSAH